ncbi:MAG: Ig-like domain-containing protein [Gemmatimonadota bacterium]
MPGVCCRLYSRLPVLLALILVQAGCGEHAGAPKATKLRVDPGTATIDIGATVRLVASAVDAQGNVVVNTNPTIEWRSLAPGIASVAQDGVVTAIATGAATMEALAGSLTGSASITVNRPPVGQLTIEPGTLSLSRGATGTLIARVVTSTGAVVTDRAVSWLSLDPAVASVAGNGQGAVVTATAPGSAVIRATSEGVSAQTTVVVGPDPVIALTATSVSLALARLSQDSVERTVQISNSAGGTLSGLTASIAYPGGAPTGWLVASLSSTSQPSTVSIRATAGTLNNGVYTATVSIASSRPGIVSQGIAVQLTIGPGPAIALSSTALGVSSFAGASAPSAQSVTVSNAGGATLTDLAIGSIDWGGTTWATVALSGTTAPVSLTITPSNGVSTLNVGTYTARIPVTSALPGVVPQLLVATLTVGPGPILSLSPSSVSFAAAVGGSAPASQSVTIGNSGGGTLEGPTLGATSYGAGASGWLNRSLSTAGDGTSSVQLSATTSSLAIGTYTAVVPITTSNPFVAPATLGVTLVVSAAQVIAIATPTLSRTVSQGGASPAPATITISNSGSGALSGLTIDPVTYTGGAGGWMSASLLGSSVPTGISLTFNTTALAVGSYGASVTVRSSLPGVFPAVLTVSLTVQSGAVIAVTPSPVNFQGLSGSTDPAAQLLTVNNSGVGALNGLSLGNTSYGSTQPVGWLSASLSTTSAPTTLTMTAAIAGLAPGTYSAIVPVQSALSGVATKAITVILRISPATTMALSSSNVTMNAPNGGGNPADASVAISNSGSNPLSGLVASVSYTGAAPTNWLTTTLSSTNAPATLTLSANVATLASGSYTASVSISSPVALNSPRTVDVTLTVPSPLISLSATSTSGSVNQSVGSVVANFSPSTISVNNAGGGRLTGVTASVTHNQGSGWLTATISSPSAPAVLTLAVNQAGAASLARGTYTATVAVSGTGAPTVYVNVTLRALLTYNTHVASLWTAAPGIAANQQCAASGCHNAITHAKNIDLLTNAGANTVYARLLALQGTGNVNLILAGSPLASLMYTRSASTSNPMPTLGIVPVIYNTLFNWITDGAHQ